MADHPTFKCESCARSFVWKPEIAGKHVKCKCGAVITIPSEVAEPVIDDDALYDLAESEAEVAKSSAAHHRVVEVPDDAASEVPAPRSSGAAAIPYRSRPTAAERTGDRFSTSNLLDMKRDVHVPIALLIIGLLMYIGDYALRYHLGAGGVVAVALGLTLMTAFKAALLVGFAMLIATPLGVSFGGLWTTALKLAAIAVFSDGVTSIIDGLVRNVAGANFTGFSGYSAISLPIAAGIYWTLIAYLFSMDPSDSWLVVILLSVFDYIIRTALVLILLRAVLSFGGVASSAMPTIGGTSAVGNGSEISMRVDALKQRQLLMPAQQMFDTGRQDVARDSVTAWQKVGVKNIWYEIDRDFSGHTEPVCIILEMPDDKDGRLRCIAIEKQFYNALKSPASPEELQDNGERYRVVRIK